MYKILLVRILSPNRVGRMDMVFFLSNENECADCGRHGRLGNGQISTVTFKGNLSQALDITLPFYIIAKI